MSKPRTRKDGYKQSKDGDWQYPVMRVPSFVSCCDCGLVHKHIIQITPDDFLVRDSRGKWRRGHVCVSRCHATIVGLRKFVAAKRDAKSFTRPKMDGTSLHSRSMYERSSR